MMSDNENIPMHEFDLSNGAEDTCFTNTVCYHCGERNLLKVARIPFLRWYQQELLIQEAFPRLTADQRELIQSGTHSKCWNEMFGEE